MKHNRGDAKLGDPLTPAELDVLEDWLEGMTAKESGIRSGRSHRTIEVHRKCIRIKYGARNAVDVVRIALTKNMESQQCAQTSPPTSTTPSSKSFGEPS